MKELKKQLDFIYEIDKAKNIFRRNYLLCDKRNENDAEHSWHLAMMAITFIEYANEGTNLLNIIKMVLVHDLVEIYAGDTYCYDEIGYLDKEEREIDAANKLFGILDIKQQLEFREIWDEFEECKTEDAIFANVLDRMHPFLLNYKNGGSVWIENKINKTQIMKRMDIVIKYNNIISEYILTLIDECIEKGFVQN